LRVVQVLGAHGDLEPIERRDAELQMTVIAEAASIGRLPLTCIQ